MQADSIDLSSQPPPPPPGAQLAAALARFQGAIDVVGKDRDVEVSGQGANYAFRYATLAQIWRAIRKALSENGLSVLQFPRVTWEYLPPGPGDKFERSRGVVTVRTVLRHVSGESESGELEMPFTKVSPQAIGSAISYARRYALGSILGLTSDDEDDDGAGAVGAEVHQRQAAAPPQRRRKPAAPQPTGPVIMFGPLKGRPVAALSFEALSDTVRFGEAKLTAEPEAAWAPAVRANVEALKAELAQRDTGQAAAAPEPEPAADAGGKPRRKRPAGGAT